MYDSCPVVGNILLSPFSLQTPDPVVQSVDGWSCDSKASLTGHCTKVAEPGILQDPDVHGRRDPFPLDAGRQEDLNTVAVESWQIGTQDNCKVAPESIGQLREEETYVIRWKYRLHSVGEFKLLFETVKALDTRP